MFYMGEVFDKETNKEYKTLNGYFVSGDPAHVKFISDPVE